MNKNRTRLAITPGDESGVGPTLLAQAISHLDKSEPIDFYWCGDAASIQKACSLATIRNGEAILQNGVSLKFFPDMPLNSLERQAAFLDLAIKLAKNQEIDAIVTGPLEKAALAHVKNGPYPGQTEYFAAHLRSLECDKPFMAFLGGPFMLSLLTTHMPLRHVADAITEDLLFEHIQAVAKYCAKINGKTRSEVKITVLGLNPHAGENGLFGNEEQKIFSRALTRTRETNLNVEGPMPADGFFAYMHYQNQQPDAVIAAYHDQGLAPYKLLSHGCAVNVTLGLSHIRVSPAHGTARDLVGTARASKTSTHNAIKTAASLAELFRPQIIHF